MPPDSHVANWANVCHQDREDPEFRGIPKWLSLAHAVLPSFTMTLRWGRVGLTAAGLLAALWLGSCTLNPQPEPPGDKSGGFDNGPTSSGATGSGGSSSGVVGAAGSSAVMNPGGAGGSGPLSATDAGQPAAVAEAGTDASVGTDASAVTDAPAGIDAPSVDSSPVDAKGDAGAADAMQDGSADAPGAVDGSGD